MDLQEIALVVTTSVAVVGVPSTLLIGRWQLRAALQTASATHQGSLRQAESAYQAALDTVRAQSDSAHDQWLRGVRREACSVFLLAVGELVELLDLVLDGTGAPDSLRPASRDLQRALAVLELEGGTQLVGAAQELVACCDEIAEAALSSSFAARTWRALYVRQMEERNAVTGREVSSTPISDAVNALSDLQIRLAGMRDAYTTVGVPTGVRPGTISALAHYAPQGDPLFGSTGEAYAALRHVYERAVRLLELTDLPREEAAVLLRDAVTDGRITVLDYMTGQSTRLSETRRAFLAAARRTLGNNDAG
ncbi:MULTISPECIES: hypothetical protein [unclassified Streptomyces]|uniref:hypothetical protein n=1 Tax=unclassified Streptomyces TaxID=2593676 RepID=UPI000B503B46|nr:MULTISPECIES: hypothetical protein [unclassified Streptomyces]MYX04139.1 hypothetical protein [Streptomyces sp. SID8378]SNB89114.1 hypothetical protein SAMN02745831_05399 [Streptomyces sp. PgraA7]